MAGISDLRRLTYLEPAFGVGHMAKILKEYFSIVHAADFNRYGYRHVDDFLLSRHKPDSFDRAPLIGF